jgi:ribA/ribD-fused uncharacterized protein
MKYTSQTIIQAQSNYSPEDFLFFWGHRNNQDGGIGKGCLSQWYQKGFSYEGNIFATAEHWMMYHKAKVFNGVEAMERVFLNDSPQVAKQVGRKVRNFDTEVWSDAAYGIVVEGNLLKFSQQEKLKVFLLSTKQRILVEVSPYDQIWGIGMTAEDQRAIKPAEWGGTNYLGFALMEVRDKLPSTTT